VPKEKRFNRDGRDWIYTPGENSSLISIPAADQPPMGMALQYRKTAKTIKDPTLKNGPLSKNRQSIAKILMSKSAY
jgi:hypothetical protein